jgi:hypothetical protein
LAAAAAAEKGTTMIKGMIQRKIAAFEAEWGYSMDYAREILDLGMKPLKKFMDAQAIGDYCEGIPHSAHYAAKILGVMAGDCGPCVQLVVDMAARDGVEEAALASLVAGDFAALPKDMKLTAEFTRALLARTDALPELREQMRERYGSAGLVSAAYAVINASMYPIVKYALGHGHACARIEIGEAQVRPVSPMSASKSERAA